MTRAEHVVTRLLETDLVRVCSACEQEFGPVPIQPGQQKSHSYCPRHTVEYFGEIGRRQLAKSPREAFPPDLAERQPPQQLDRADYGWKQDTSQGSSF